MLRGKGMLPYLVQRGKTDSNPNKEGIDSIIAWDYMGSSEFEFGALGKSLRAIRSKSENYIFFDVNVNNIPVTIFCLDSQRGEVKTCVRGLGRGDYGLKEYCDFEYLAGKSRYFKCSSNFWWDIENHYMFWIADPEFTRYFKEVIF